MPNLFALSVTHKACHLSQSERLRVLNVKEQFLRSCEATDSFGAPPQMLASALHLKEAWVVLSKKTIPPPLRGTSFYTKEAWVCADFC